MSGQFAELARKIISESDAAVRALTVKILKENKSGIEFVESKNAGIAVRLRLVKTHGKKHTFKDLQIAADVITAEADCVECYADRKTILLTPKLPDDLARNTLMDNAAKEKIRQKADKRFRGFAKNLFSEIGVSTEIIQRI